MNPFTRRHHEAMELADQAQLAMRHGEASRAKEFYRQAFNAEWEAVSILQSQGGHEPARSVLLKSAAYLAIDCEEYRRAEQMAAMGLSGDPPDDLADELREVLELATFRRHLSVKGVALEANDLQLVIAGDAVAPGMAPTEEVVGRVGVIQKLVLRTQECDLSIPYRDRGAPRAEIENRLRTYMSTPRAASFAVSIRVASAPNQIEMGFADSSAVILQLADRLELFEQERLEDLRSHIPQQEYYDNFIELASELAPDGQRVSTVGITVRSRGVERQIAMRRVGRGVGPDGEGIANTEPRRFDTTARVVVVNARHENPVVRVVDADGGEFAVTADEKSLEVMAKAAIRRKQVSIKGEVTGKDRVHVESVQLSRKTVTVRAIPVKERVAPPVKVVRAPVASKSKKKPGASKGKNNPKKGAGAKKRPRQ